MLCLSLTIVMVANMSLNLALPAIARDLDASTTALQWMVDAYALVFAGLAVHRRDAGRPVRAQGRVAGRAGAVPRRRGRRAATAETSGMVIAGRGVMGVAAAFVMPSTLSIITSACSHRSSGAGPSPPGRAWPLERRAGADRVGPAARALLVGLGLPRERAPGRGGARHGVRWVPTSRDPDGHPLDVPGALLSIVGVGALVYAIIEARRTAGPTR